MYRQGLAPQIQDLYGKVDFTGECDRPQVCVWTFVYECVFLYVTPVPNNEFHLQSEGKLSGADNLRDVSEGSGEGLVS